MSVSVMSIGWSTGRMAGMRSVFQWQFEYVSMYGPKDWPLTLPSDRSTRFQHNILRQSPNAARPPSSIYHAVLVAMVVWWRWIHVPTLMIGIHFRNVYHPCVRDMSAVNIHTLCMQTRHENSKIARFVICWSVCVDAYFSSCFNKRGHLILLVPYSLFHLMLYESVLPCRAMKTYCLFKIFSSSYIHRKMHLQFILSGFYLKRHKLSNAFCYWVN